jgi:hypothetical protein
MMDHEHMHDHESTKDNSYTRLYIILGLIGLVSLLLTAKEGIGLPEHSLSQFFMRFSAGFFLVFSGVKLLDLPGFVDGYTMYDVIAKRVRAYAYIYPFLELALGVGYILGGGLVVNVGTIILMGVSSIGVVQVLAKKQKIMCSCLGTILNVPLSTVTLVEDLGMLLMALIMLALS